MESGPWVRRPLPRMQQSFRRECLRVLALFALFHVSSILACGLLHCPAYEYDMEFRDTLSHGNADALSRLPLPVCPPEGEQLPEIILLMDHLSDSPVTAQQI